MSSEKVGTFYFDVLHTLEELGCSYVIIGAFAAAAYGGQRTTKDIDIVVDLSRERQKTFGYDSITIWLRCSNFRLR